MPTLSLNATRQTLAAHSPHRWPAFPGRTNHRRAAVLLPLQFDGDGGARCLLIQRTPHLRDHAGEVGFPGGKPEPVDGGDLTRTALREAEEELGLPRADMTMLGRLSSVPLFTSDYRLEPFVAAIPGDAVLDPEPGEVAAVLSVSLTALLEAPFTHGLPFTWQGEARLSPVFPLSPRALYGGSAFVLWELLGLLGERPPLRPSPDHTWDTIKQPIRGA